MRAALEHSTAQQHRAAMAAQDATLQLGHGFWGSKALLSAIELGLFSELAEAGALEGDALRERVGLPPEGAREFFDALVALGTLEREGDTYRNTTSDLLFDRSKPTYTFGSAASAFVVDALCEFRRRHPGVRVSIAEGMPSSLIHRLRAGDLDLAAVFDFPEVGEDIGDGLELHHLLDQPFDIVLHPSHPLAGENRVRPADLSHEDWVLPDFGPDSPSLKLVGRMCAAAGFEPRISFRTNDCQVTLARVAAGEGVSILPRLMLDPVRPDVVVKPVEGDAPTQRVAAVRLPTRCLAPTAAQFLVALQEAAKRRTDSWARWGTRSSAP